TWLTSRVPDAAALAARLWDLDGWAARASVLIDAMRASRPRLDAGATDELRPAFVLAAAVLRHLQADPLLPDALLPHGWPGDDVRRAYEAYETSFQSLLAASLRMRRASASVVGEKSS